MRFVSYRIAFTAALVALVAFVGLNLVLFPTLAGASPQSMIAVQTAGWQAQPGTLEPQLDAAGYTLTKTASGYSSDAGKVVHWQVWTLNGRPTVILTDSYTVDDHSFRIDSVRFPEGAGAYIEFWCAPPAGREYDLAETLWAAMATQEALSNGNPPMIADDALPGEFDVDSWAPCWVR